MQAVGVQEGWEEWVGSWVGGMQRKSMAEARGGPQPHAYGWRRDYSLPPSLSHHSGLNSLVGLADWRHKRRQQKQLEAAKAPATEAMQPESAEEAGQDGKVEAAGAEEVEEENLPPVQHRAWEAPRLRALNEVLSVELQPEELLLEAVEAPWREESDEESSGGEMEVVTCSSLQPGGLVPEGVRDVVNGQDGRGKQHTNAIDAYWPTS